MFKLGPAWRLSHRLIRRADAARDARQYAVAAALYEEALRLVPSNAAIQVQCGHMLKETGELALAEQHYLIAQRLTPRDADLALQLGHLYKASGRLAEAMGSYRRAGELQPGWAEPARELEGLRRRAEQADGTGTGTWAEVGEWAGHGLGRQALELARAGRLDALAPELIARPPESLLHHHHEHIDVRRLGRRERSRWGLRPTLRGVEAIRGFCISVEPVAEFQLRLDGVVLHAGPLQGHTLKYEIEKEHIKKYVFNVWHDFTDVAPGRHTVELRCTKADGGVARHTEEVVVAAPLPPEATFDTDAYVVLDRSDPRSAEDRINALPSVIRPGRRALFPEPIRSILVLRTDQLGDLVMSVPALRRLREHFPDARLVGLFTPANVDLARTLGVFDEVIAIDFPDDPMQRRRTMPIEQQAELRQRLAPYRFDVAIDLMEIGNSRPLLLLTGARVLFGYRADEFPWLTADLASGSHDPLTRHEIVPHSAKQVATIDWLAAMLRPQARILRRSDLGPERLGVFGLSEGDRYAIVHTGARYMIARWPHYDELIGMLVAQTDLRVVVLTEDPAARAVAPADLVASGRLVIVDRRLAFDEFDALLSFCTVFIGNDSGPKHLASLRGASVVSIHLSRNSRPEWGQEMVGTIVSRRVPCASCSIQHDPEECGKDFVCLMRIRPEEVLDAVRQAMAQPAA